MLLGKVGEQRILRQPAERRDLQVGLAVKVFLGEAEPLGLTLPDQLPHKVANPRASLDFLTRDRPQKGLDRGVEQQCPCVGPHRENGRNHWIDDVRRFDHVDLAAR